MGEIEDLYEQRYPETRFWHKRCWSKHKTDKSKEEFEKVFADAGFKGIFMTPIPNEYYPGHEYYGPWWLVQTKWGDVKIGWRKRVINIDWSAIEKSVTDFPTEDVTKGPTFIHAWGYEKAIEYLTKLRETWAT